MPEITINKVVIHELVKEQHQNIQPSHIRPSVLDPNHEIVIKLVDGITKLYATRNNSAHYGTFRTGEGRGEFPSSFNNYSTAKNVTDEQFMELSEVGMDELFRKAENSMAASGGYILFSDYMINRERFFIVAMIKQKSGITLSPNLEPEELTELDLNRLYQAAKINLNKLEDYENADETERQEINYLSFISSSTGHSASGYFVTALGCARGTAGSRATGTLITESYAFFRENEQIRGRRNDFRTDLMAYLHRKHETKESVKLSEIEALARRHFPAAEQGQADALADEFIARLNNEQNAVPTEFPVHQTTLKKHTHISYNAENWDLKFDRCALGTTDDAQIYYDQQHNRVIIRDLPEEMVEKINAELESRQVE